MTGPHRSTSTQVKLAQRLNSPAPRREITTSTAPQPKRPRMTLRSWKPPRKGSLIGFASVNLPIGLQIDDVPVLVSNGKAWATLPAQPVITADGRVAKLPGSSKPQYVSFLRWRDRDLSARFSAAVVELVLEQHPDALADGDAP